MIIKFKNIKYETDGQKIKLPRAIELDVLPDINIEEEGADMISNETGFLVNSFEYEVIKDMTRKELQDKLNIVFEQSTLGDIKIINKELNDYCLVKNSTLKEWVNKLMRIRDNGDEVEALEDLIDLETTILSTYR